VRSRALLLALLLATRAFAAPAVEAEDDYTTPRVMMVIGWVLLLAGYTFGAGAIALQDLAGNATPHDRLAYVPVFGPFAAAPPHDSFDMSGFLIADGITQTFGIGLIFGAIVARHPNREDAGGYRWSLAPTAGRAPGVSLSVGF
jgi:hypothetical protein